MLEEKKLYTQHSDDRVFVFTCTHCYLSELPDQPLVSRAKVTPKWAVCLPTINLRMMNTQALNTLEEMASSTLIQEPNGVFSSSGHHFTQTTTRTAVKTASGSESVYGVMLVGAFTARWAVRRGR